eukprot:7759385-Alexandrium_andersonii.AAC.1
MVPAPIIGAMLLAGRWGVLLKSLAEVEADFEQCLPQLDYTDNEGRKVEAIMGVVHEHQQLGRLWIDVVCNSAHAGDAQRRLAA